MSTVLILETKKIVEVVRNTSKEFYCIVKYNPGSPSPLYYEGVYQKGKPTFTSNFDEALKLHNTTEASRIKGCIQKDTKARLTIEDHAYV